jgi:hypothetical protein
VFAELPGEVGPPVWILVLVLHASRSCCVPRCEALRPLGLERAGDGLGLAPERLSRIRMGAVADGRYHGRTRPFRVSQREV